MKKLIIPFIGLFLASACWGGLPKIEPGEPVPEYLGYGLHGDKVSSEVFLGDVVLLSFWATWCGPCLKELPLLIELQEATQGRGLQIVAINYRESQQTVQDAMSMIEGTGIFWTSDPWGQFSEYFGVKGIPFHVLVDVDGIVTDVFTGYSHEQFLAIIDSVEAQLLACKPRL